MVRNVHPIWGVRPRASRVPTRTYMGIIAALVQRMSIVRHVVIGLAACGHPAADGGPDGGGVGVGSDGSVVELRACDPANASVVRYYVSPSGSDDNSCATATSQSPADHKATVAAGIACLSPGQALCIHGGTYTAAGDVIDSQTYPVPSGTSWSDAITIAGVPGETVTLRPSYNVSGVRLIAGTSYLIIQDLIIDMSRSVAGADADGIFMYQAHHIRFRHVEVMNGASFGVHFGDQTPFNEMLECSIHDFGLPNSTPSEGHGLYITGSDNLFEGNHVYNNQGYGFHIYNNHGSHDDPSRNVIRNNKIDGNGVHGSPAYAIVLGWGDGNLVYNNLIYRNQGGVSLYTASTRSGVYNNTIYANHDEGLMLQYYADGQVIRNNIIYANGADIVDFGGVGAPTSDHNLLTDPSFTNADAGDFTLKPGSAARDAGATIPEVTDDYAHHARQDAAYDIGAFEL